MLSRRIFLASILASALLATACLKDAVREMTKSVGEMMTVRNELMKKFGEEVNVNITQHQGRSVLTVTFINSALNDKTREERLKRAQEAAQVVSLNYARGKNLAVVWIGFARVKTQYIVFHQSQMFDFFPFDTNGVQIDPARNGNYATVDGLETNANYLSTSDETDVSCAGIQLDGRPGGLGITVLPHFKVKGDAKEEPAPPPKDVAFDFASYSEKPRFLGDTTPIAFIAGGKVVFQTKGTFHGNDAQFCYLPVPYAAFKKIVTASDLVIKLGDKEYPLTPRQFTSIQQMDRYVQQ